MILELTVYRSFHSQESDAAILSEYILPASYTSSTLIQRACSFVQSSWNDVNRCLQRDIVFVTLLQIQKHFVKILQKSCAELDFLRTVILKMFMRWLDKSL